MEGLISIAVRGIVSLILFSFLINHLLFAIIVLLNLNSSDIIYIQLWSSVEERSSALVFLKLKICDGNIQRSFADARVMLFGVWRTSYAFRAAKGCEWRISLKEISTTCFNG